MPQERSLKIGFTTSNLSDPYFLTQYASLLEHGIHPDFVFLHYGGWFYKSLKYGIKGMKRLLRADFSAYKPSRINHVNAQSADSFPDSVSLAAVAGDLKKVRIINCLSINHNSTIRKIRKAGPSMIMAHSGILRNKVLSLTDTVFVNIHTSKLPHYRGMNNVEWALLEYQEIWCSIHRISRGIDEGDILYQEQIHYQPADLISLPQFRAFCFYKSHAMLGKALEKYFKGEINFVPQSQKGIPLMQYYSMHPILKQRLPFPKTK
jgi:hypothetical protein